MILLDPCLRSFNLTPKYPFLSSLQIPLFLTLQANGFDSCPSLSAFLPSNLFPFGENAVCCYKKLVIQKLIFAATFDVQKQSEGPAVLNSVNPSSPWSRAREGTTIYPQSLIDETGWGKGVPSNPNPSPYRRNGKERGHLSHRQFRRPTHYGRERTIIQNFSPQKSMMQLVHKVFF